MMSYRYHAIELFMHKYAEESGQQMKMCSNR